MSTNAASQFTLNQEQSIWCLAILSFLCSRLARSTQVFDSCKSEPESSAKTKTRKVQKPSRRTLAVSPISMMFQSITANDIKLIFYVFLPLYTQ